MFIRCTRLKCLAVLFLSFRPVAALPAACYFPARCSMEKQFAANGARRERLDNGIEPRTCAPAAATGQRITNCHPIPRRSSFAPVFPRQITRHTCRVNFELTHSKQRIGAIAKCHRFRGSVRSEKSAGAGADAAVFGAVAEQAGLRHFLGVNHAGGQENIGGIG